MILLHLLAALFFYPALFVTIPFHIIISMKEEEIKKQQFEEDQKKKNKKLSKFEIIFYIVFSFFILASLTYILN